MKVVWIINQYASTSETGIGGRHYYLGKQLAKKGCKVYIITASYSHILHKPKQLNDWILVEKIDKNFNYVWIKTLKYKNAHSKKRVLNWIIFTFKVLKLLKKLETPNIIISSSPQPFVFLSAYKIAKKVKSKLFFEVRDIWPLSLIELGNISSKHPFIRLMGWVEKRAYQKSNYIISNLINFYEYLQQFNIPENKFIWISNGVCLEEMDVSEPLDKNIIKRIPKDKFIVGYAGSIGLANALEYLLEAAELLKENKNIFFIIIGEGSEKSKLMKKYSGLDNILFLPAIPKKQIQCLLYYFDVCYIGWLKKRMYNYGVAANKIFDYMYSEKPILHSYSGKQDIILKADCGLTVEAENSKAIAEGILKFYEMPKEKYYDLGKNGKQYILRYLTYKKLAEKLENYF